MLHIIPKWKVTVTFDEPNAPHVVEFWVSNAHLGNVLRTVAEMEFAPWPAQPVSLTVQTVSDAAPTVSLSRSDDYYAGPNQR